jgi:leucine dehydrogenase
MAAFWTDPDFDDHELVHFVHEPAIGLTAIIALHSTHLGPGGGGTRFWHYPDPADALKDALRLSRGMSYKNAMAGLPMGGGKGVILADPDRTKTEAMLAAYGQAIETLGGRYVTAEDVGMTTDDMFAIWNETDHVSGLPVEAGMAGGDPGPFTAYGIYLGIKAAVAHRLGRDDLAAVHVALQGAGSVGGGVARLLARDGAKLTLADLDPAKAELLADELGARTVSADEIMRTPCDVFSPNALGAILDEYSIPALDCAVVAGGANNQLARPGHGEMLAARDILYAPDFVINAGGIIDVVLEYLGRRAGQPNTAADVNARIEQIPQRLRAVWREAGETGLSPDVVAEEMARKLIGRG